MNKCGNEECQNPPTMKVETSKESNMFCQEHYSEYIRSIDDWYTSIPLTIPVSAASRESAISKINEIIYKINNYKSQIAQSIDEMIQGLSEKRKEFLEYLDQSDYFLREIIERVENTSVIYKNSYIDMVNTWLIDTLNEETKHFSCQYNLITLDMDPIPVVNLDFIKIQNRLGDLLKINYFCYLEDPIQKTPVIYSPVCFQCQEQFSTNDMKCGHKYCNECFQGTCRLCFSEADLPKARCEHCNKLERIGISQCSHILCLNCSETDCPLCLEEAQSFLCQYCRHRKNNTDLAKLNCSHEYCLFCLTDSTLASFHNGIRTPLDCKVCGALLTKEDVQLIGGIVPSELLAEVIDRYFPKRKKASKIVRCYKANEEKISSRKQI